MIIQQRVTINPKNSDKTEMKTMSANSVTIRGHGPAT